MFPTLITMDMTVYSALLSWFDHTGYDCLQWTFVLVWLHWLWLFTVYFCLGLITLVMTVYSGLLSGFDYTGYVCLQWTFILVWLHFLWLFTVDYGSWFDYTLDMETFKEKNRDYPIHVMYYEDMKEVRL